MSDSQERDLLAAEYVLGLLSREQAGALEALALNDPAVADSIAAWQNRLAPLADIVPPQPPPALLWRRLALATGIEAAEAAPSRLPLLARTNFWRATTAAALAIAASLAVVLVRPAPEPPRELAVLSPSGAPAAAFVVLVAPDGRAMVLPIGTVQPPSGKSFELWALREGASTPVSLGVLPTVGRRRIELQTPTGTKLLISQEPQGGSPTGLPTGPVVYSGTLGGA